MSSMVDFDALQAFMDVPEAARRRLNKPEKEIHFNLNLIDERTEVAFRQMLAVATEKGCSLRQDCDVIAVQELVDSMHDRGWI